MASEQRTRIAFDAPTKLVNRAKKIAERLDSTVAEVARDAFQRLIDAEDVSKVAPKGRESKVKRQARFLEAVELKFSLSGSCRAAEIPKDEAKEWLKDPQFADKFLDAKEAYVETIEEKLVELGEGKSKGQVLALIAFLNSNNPNYGRLKIEQVSKMMGSFIDRAYDVVRTELGNETGEAIVRKLKQEADLRLSVLTQ